MITNKRVRYIANDVSLQSKYSRFGNFKRINTEMKCFKCCKTRSNGTPWLQNVTFNLCVCFTELRDIDYVANQPDSSTVKVRNKGEEYRKYMN